MKMVRVRYPGLTHARESFEALRPLRAQLVYMQSRCRPFGGDYLVLDAAKRTLDTAAYHFTGEPDFFALRAPRS